MFDLDLFWNIFDGFTIYKKGTEPSPVRRNIKSYQPVLDYTEKILEGTKHPGLIWNNVKGLTLASFYGIVQY